MKNLILQEIRQLKEKRERTQSLKQIPKSQPKEESTTGLSKTQTSTSVNSVKSSSQLKASGLNLFKGLSFCFPQIDVDLSPKRVEYMTKSIISEGGRVQPFCDKQLSERVDYLLINPKVGVGNLLKRIENKIDFKLILDYNFVLHCMRQSILLAISNYTIYKSKSIAPGQQNQEDTVSLSPFPKKMVKVEGARGNNFVREEKGSLWDGKQKQKRELVTEDEADDDDQTLSIKSRREVEPVVQRQTQKKQKGLSRVLNKQSFLCQRGQSAQSLQKFSINKFICEQLMQLQKIYENEKDVGRKIAYLKAVSAIKSLDKEIESQRDLENLRGVGGKIIKKVKELLETGRLQKLERMRNSEKRVAVEQLSRIWGVGPSKAEELYAHGIRSVVELRDHPQLLNKNQKIGLRYFQDFQQKIPRDKVTRIFEFVRQVLGRMVGCIEDYHLEVCGSYRRERPFCGDIDILISRKDGKFQRKLLLELVLQLQRQGLLTDHLVFPSSSSNPSSMSYMGVCVLGDDLHHRIDMKYYPIGEYPYALLYFTGSGMFNRSMRLYASKIGIQLSDHGALPRSKNTYDQTWDKPIPVCTTQRDIFEFLGLDYKTPTERDV